MAELGLLSRGAYIPKCMRRENADHVFHDEQCVRSTDFVKSSQLACSDQAALAGWEGERRKRLNLVGNETEAAGLRHAPPLLSAQTLASAGSLSLSAVPWKRSRILWKMT